jgi:8-oxo-dGTP pyrophosphatase MutT (NUDIX family)
MLGRRTSWRAQTQSEVAATPRAAASVVLVRSTAGGGLETFMVRRSKESRFAADVFVFPGGTVAADDLAEPMVAAAPNLPPDVALRRLSDRGGTPPADAGLAFGLYAAAVRELFEEAGVLLADDACARDVTGPVGDRLVADQLVADRAALQRGEQSLPDLAARRGLYLALDRLVYFSHWVTPALSPRRYDTRFFVATMPPDQTALHCQIETTDGLWVAPGEALRRCEAGAFKLVSVTISHLERLATFASVEALLRFARSKPVRTVHPTLDAASGTWATNVPEDAW